MLRFQRRPLRSLLPLVALIALLTAVLLPGAAEGQTGTIVSGGIPPTGGFGLIVFGGGSNDQLVVASGCPSTTAVFWATSDGQFVTFIPGATVAVVNAEWNALFAGGIPADTALLGRCTDSPAAGVGMGVPATGERCGTERWTVKTLSDLDADRVHFTASDTTVLQLRALPKPASLPAASRVAPVELTVFRLTAEVVEFKLEDDRDVHLVIADPVDPSATMIVEFPDAERCSGAITSAHAQEMKVARAALIATFGMPSASRFERISGTVTLTGVGFFDVLHGQRGVAPNGIELHPVLRISIGAAPASVSEPVP